MNAGRADHAFAPHCGSDGVARHALLLCTLTEQSVHDRRRKNYTEERETPYAQEC